MSVIGGAQWEMERRYSVAERGLPPPSLGMVPSTSEDLHAWSIYRQNLNSDFTDSALGSSEKSPLPYGNFQLRESTVQSILNHPRYGPKSALGSNMYTYLKFGLPRVFPPNGPRGKESSSYGSSEDGGSKRARRPSTAYLRARSEADLTNIHYTPTVSGRGKSISQANLLSPDLIMNRQQASQRRSLADLRPHQTGRPASLAVPLGHPLNHHLHHMHHIHHVRPSSVMEPHEPFSFSMLHPHQYTGLYPHLQVRNLNMRNTSGEPLVTNLSMEVKAGEILAIMATKNGVAASLLDCLSGKRRYSGQISLNGQAVTSRELRARVAQVRSDTILPPDLPVDNCLRYYAKLRQPPESRGKIPMGEQVRMVTEELGLSPVLETKVSHLTRSEYSRLLVAVQLLTDSQILCIDQITYSMDIFDTFFLVEFLRQWASGATGGVAGRVVVMSLQPPTYEILTMVSRLVILSGPEPMYHGPSRLLSQYFTTADYPCPAYKNPADYYLDLVTLDDLSAEAMLESSQRVDQLTSLYKRRQAPLSDPQPYSLPSKFSTAGPFKQAYTLLLRDLIYSQPSSFCSWISRVLISAFMSLVLGVIFWDVPASDPQLNREDRLGYHFAVLVVCSLPLVLSMGLDKSHSKLSPSAESDINQGLYSRPLYILCTLIYSLIPSCLVWMAYLVPAYCMSGLYDQVSSDALTVYLGYSLTVLITVEYTVSLLGMLVLSMGGGRGAAMVTALALVWLLGPLHSAYPLHSGEAPAMPVIGYLSPLPSLYPALVVRDYEHDTLQRFNSHLVCRNKQVQHQDIIVHLPCPVPNGTAALEYRGINQLLPTGILATIPSPPTPPYTTSLIILTVVSFASIFIFTLKPLCHRRKRSHR